MSSAIVHAALAPLYLDSRGTELADEVFHGFTVEVIGKDENGLCRVRTAYGYEGFAPSEALIAEPAALSAYASPNAIVAAPVADAAASPSIRGGVVTTLFMGAYLRKEGERDGYAAVRLATGQPAFVRAEQVADMPARRGGEELRRGVAEAALALEGAPYRWGGKTRLGVDCSGLAWLAYHMNGVGIYRDAKLAEGWPIKPIAPERAQRGDLLFLPGHVAVCLGGGMAVHSAYKNNGVKVARVCDLGVVIGAGAVQA